MGHLPPLPSDEAICASLPWWTRTVMLEARKLGIQHHAAGLLKEVWRLQDSVSWYNSDEEAIIDEDGGKPADWLTSEKPSDELLTEFWTWAAVVCEAYGADKNWCHLFGVLSKRSMAPAGQEVYVNGGYGIDGFNAEGCHRNGHDQDGNPHPSGVRSRSGPPPWANVARARKW